MKGDKMDDPRVTAVRDDKLVGRNTCSTVDECYSDQDLAKALDEANIQTPVGAYVWARKLEDLQMEQALNQRWGEDNDPELKMAAEWEARKQE